MSRLRGPALLAVAALAVAVCGLVCTTFAVPQATQRPTVITRVGNALTPATGSEQSGERSMVRATHVVVSPVSVASQLANPFIFCVLLALLAKPVRKLQGELHDKLKGNSLVVGTLSEFSATFMFIFFSIGSAIWFSAYVSHIGCAVVFGGTIFVLATIFGPISGGHMNPAVSFGLYAAGQIKTKTMVSYICAQTLGATLAAVALKCVGLKVVGGINMLAHFTNVGIWGAFAMEALGSALLVSTVLSGGGALPIATAVAVAHLLLVPVTGCSINPARSLGPALVTGHTSALKHLWVFLSAPMLGGWLAGTKACWFKK